MKKAILALSIVSVAFASCNNGSTDATTTDSTKKTTTDTTKAVPVTTPTTDSVKKDTTVVKVDTANKMKK